MRQKKTFTVLAFPTTVAAMRTEKYCAERQIPGRVIPLPPEISAGCGIAWRMEVPDWARYGDELLRAVPEIAEVREVEQWIFEKEEEGCPEKEKPSAP